MMCPDAKVEKVYLYPKPVDFRKSIDGLAALVELDIKVAVFDPVLFVFLNRHRNRVKSSTGSATAFADRLFGRKSEQTVEPNTPQLALFNEPESEPMTLVGDADEEVVAPTPRRGKRKPLSADLPRIEVIHELPEHELTCACGCRKHVISEETSEQLDIVPMQIRAIKHVRKVYGCRGCETAPVTADIPAQLIEKSMASPSVLAMLLTTKYVDGLPLHRFETVLSRHGIDIPRQTLARWVIQCSEHFQPLLNLMRDRLLESPNPRPGT